MSAPEGGCLLWGCVSAPGGVCLLWGVSAPGGCLVRGVSALGGSAPEGRGCTWFQGGVPGQALPPWTDTRL